MARDGWGVDDIRQRCAELRAVLANEPTCCSPEQLADYWPGGAENRLPGRGGWIYCYAQYSAFLRRLETTAPESGARRLVAERAARDAARGVPEVVELDARDEFGAPKSLTIHPKSFHAICYIEDWGELVTRLTAAYLELKASRNSGAFATHSGDVLGRISYYQRVIVWALNHAPAGLPFADGIPPDPPEWTRDLTPADFVRITQAHQVVNGARLALALQLIQAPGSDSGRASQWSTLLPVAAKEIGVTLREVTRDLTLESVVAQLALIRDAERQDAAPSRSPAPTMPEML